jgi:glycosyltransferase involved in cell wall biosynthesis
MKNRSASLELAGPAESKYLQHLKSLIHSLHLDSRVSFTPAIYELSKKIAKLDSAHLFILPSLREGMPQALIEAMARKKLVIASDNFGNKDLIENGKNGFLFPVGNAQALAACIDSALSLSQKEARKIQNAGRTSVKQFAWSTLIKKLEALLQEVIRNA